MHVQQQPRLVFHFGNLKHSPKNFQSPRTSTKAARMPSCSGPPGRDAFCIRVLSPLPLWNSVPSCRRRGHVPLVACCMLQAITPITSSQVWSEIRDRSKAVKGSRRALYAPLCPDKFRLKFSQLSDLSQLQGAPSPQRPTGIKFVFACVSQCTKCAKEHGSRPLLSCNARPSLNLCNTSRSSCGSKNATHW